MMHPLRMTINKIKFPTSSEEECYHTLYTNTLYEFLRTQISDFEDENLKHLIHYCQPKKINFENV